jgi:myo-inositol 2-dehydrogenase / D-chiro-inositol 1-dehydrogenase
MRGALLGVGRVALHGHVPGWRERADVEIVAAADSRSEGRDAFHAVFPNARWYPAAADLLANEKIEFVDICTPPDTHAGLIRTALERSCHVLCEKPLVLRAGELGPLAALAATRQRALVSVHNWSHAPALAKVTELVRAGTVGIVRRCRWQTLRTEPAAAARGQDNWRVDPARSGGGILVDHGWHAFYVVNSWLGRPRYVRAQLTTRRHHSFSTEDTALVDLDYETTAAEIFLTWAADERANRVEIEGTQGMLRLDGGQISLEAGKAPRQFWELPSLAAGSHHPDWFRGVIESFLGEVESTAARGRSLDEAALCVMLISLAEESSRLGEALQLPEVSG